MIKILGAFISLVVMALSLEPALALELVAVRGKVAVNAGDGFEPAKRGMALKGGDQIFLGEKSSASIYYPNADCRLNYPPFSVSVISDIPPCLPGEKIVTARSVVIRPAADLPPDAKATECPGDQQAAALEAPPLQPIGSVIEPTADVIDKNAKAEEQPPIDPCAQAAAPLFPLAALLIPAAAVPVVIIGSQPDPPISGP